MNFHDGGPSSNYLYSSSSSSEAEEESYAKLRNEQMAIHHQQQMCILQLQTNAVVVSEYFQQFDNTYHHGSIPGHVVINRDRATADQRLYNDYFSSSPVYNETMFKRRFRMSRRLFSRILEAVQAHDTYFVQKPNASGQLGLSPHQKITAAMRILAYGVAADATDEYIKIGESTSIESVKRFCRAVVELFGDWYLRSPNTEDIARLLHIGEKRGFPGMLGSVDCMHWKWKNCPTAWAGQYAGRSGSPTIILEAVADHELWIWHAFFGLPGSNNDINVLSKSHLFSNLANDVAPPANYVIQGKEYTMGYYLADGIYPKWATLVQTIHKPKSPKQQHFAARQESCRKDVERAFGVLQSKWGIIKGPARVWDKKVLHNIMTACIIMHNMIIEDERDVEAPIPDYCEVPTPEVEIAYDEHSRFQQFLARHRQIKDKSAHYALRDALIDHLWEEFSNLEY